MLFLITSVAVHNANAQSSNAAKPKPVDRKKFVEEICFRIQVVSKAQNIPEAFLARLIWKESRFDPNAVSPVGAQGIAQFMPGTAKIRGLKDPFEPHQAIAASASYLVDLRREFGNWGLAAAAYNGGPGRVAAWRSGNSGLPFETQDFVESITGFRAIQWNQPGFQAPVFKLSKTEDFQTSCNKFSTKYSLFRTTVSTSSGTSGTSGTSGSVARRKPWGVQVAGHFSRSKALQIYSRLQRKYPSVLRGKAPQVVSKRNRSFGNRPRYNVQIGANNRAQGEAFCSKLKRVGGSCVVLKN